MPSNESSRIIESTGVLYENEPEKIFDKSFAEQEPLKPRKYVLIWHQIILMFLAHCGALIGIFLMFASARIYTTIFAFLMYFTTGISITAGSHRLWTHRSYKAKLPLQILLLVFHTASYQRSVIKWCRDHRIHHKFTETDADPHNAKRGFFFAHLGWLLCEEHPEVTAKEKTIDLSDLLNDPLLRFQHDYYYILMPLACFILPALVPLLWGDNIINGWFVAVLFRWVFQLNVTEMVNSVLHLYGNHPYDRFINPTENTFVSIFSHGEGWHNYHHVFPWDYKAGELGDYNFNHTTCFIDLMAKIGWAYDLKSVAPETVKRRVQRTGDGSHPVWGWGDKDGNELEKTHALITCTTKYN